MIMSARVYGFFRKKKQVEAKNKNVTLALKKAVRADSEQQQKAAQKSLQQEIDAFVVKITEGVSNEVLQKMQQSTLKLVQSRICNSALTIGDTAPVFELPDHNGNVFNSAVDASGGPLIVTFYRGAWCPYCNLQLKYYDDYAYKFEQVGAKLVAVSPNLAEYTAQVANQVSFTVLSDVDNVVAKQFGLIYSLDEQLRPIYEQWGFFIPQQNGNNSFELPLAATYVIAPSNNKIIYSFVNADYTKRAEPDDILQALATLTTN